MAAVRADDVLHDLGRRVAELRAARTMTQEQFAETAGVTVQYLQRVEAGRENLTVRSLVRMATLLRVSVTDLFAKPAQRDVRPGRPRRQPPR
jgi:transcriptional regulator with XRE-family HTH domain